MPLNLQQKRQAALLHDWMSAAYLRQLKALIDAVIKGTDPASDVTGQQSHYTASKHSWRVASRAAIHASSNVYSALEDFREATIRDIANRAMGVYALTGATQCARLLEEFSSQGTAQAEGERFRQQFEAAYQHAQCIDFAVGVGGLRHQLHDWSMAHCWLRFGHRFSRLPKFRVRRDVEGSTGEKPPRSGVYVAQGDDCATLQFAWTGSDDGVLGEAETLNDLGRSAVAAIGRDAMWVDGAAMAAWASGAFSRGELTDRHGFEPGDESDTRWVAAIVFPSLRARRASRWSWVEPVEGEYDTVPSDSKG